MNFLFTVEEFQYFITSSHNLPNIFVVLCPDTYKYESFYDHKAIQKPKSVTAQLIRVVEVGEKAKHWMGSLCL